MEIFNRLNEIPHLQEIIVGHYKSALNKDHEEHDKKKLHQNTAKSNIPGTFEFLDGEYKTDSAYRSSKYWKKKIKRYDDDLYKLYYKAVKKTEKIAKTKECNPFPSFDCLNALKLHISDCKDDANIKYPNSKKKREKYIVKHFKNFSIR